uniref:NADH-ubiquinone oxidoreductase chain 2 n=1 Tax=Empoascanara plamka TaxID=2906264 RepID=A0AA51NHG5_9HEMI|nr:NADH dehydrogenase subunit 2 [Empoascanara plamka]WMQ52361.1 NADH dehydrogenase subunit 2 [Empoascanara plamka]
MKMNSSKMFFLSFMIVGVMICLCSNNWLFIWAGLEISLITTLPLMQSKLIISSESMMKYFLIQSISSGLLIMGLMVMLTNLINTSILMTSSILIKMGIAPFHNWLVSVIEPMKMLPLMLILTISKIPALMILSIIQVSMTMIILITLMTGSIKGLSQTSMKKLITYSSIFNMGLILSVTKNNFMWSFYLIVYAILLFMLTWIVFEMNATYINQLLFNQKLMMTKYTLWINLISLGGMPPLMGFSIKLMVMEFMISKMMITILFFTISTSMLIMFFYLRMTYLSLMFYSHTPKWNLLTTTNTYTMTILVNFFTTPMILIMKIMN